VFAYKYKLTAGTKRTKKLEKILALAVFIWYPISAFRTVCRLSVCAAPPLGKTVGGEDEAAGGQN
jgi:hypothetical protein